ncbi:unknown [Coprobacillus sp. CAG:605]|nr:unknown [Coprobacillus sp. CAG:605]
MKINLQYKIKNTKGYYEYLKDNSWWIKNLSRNPDSFNDYQNYLKDKYELRTSDKISKAIDNIDLISSLLSAIK